MPHVRIVKVITVTNYSQQINYISNINFRFTTNLFSKQKNVFKYC